ncbi:ScyD/ScyE family protein [Dyadobacter sp. 676]|uniref:ScyD/ScyE family protein n=1 Tax=Dyadobacter sp. 676 TaxID=3088362 RepID=A0AAU8FPS8_9BACT
MKKYFLSFLAFAVLAATALMVACTDHVEPIPEPTQFSVSGFTGGLHFPIGLVVDEKGQLWVSEAGTGNNDGAVVMITPGGVKTTVLSGFKSSSSPEGGPEGISHMYYENGTLYVLHGVEGLLYIVDVSNFDAGDPPLAKNLVPTENIADFVLTQNLTNPLNSNPYSLTKGPDGHLYIADAGANAIIKRDKDTKMLSVFAKIPGPAPTTDAVPTGIVFDGSKFLLSTLTGFPFAPGAASIFQVTPAGQVSPYKTGFTTLTHLTLTANNKPLVLHFANFAPPPGPPVGFVPGTGSILNEDGMTLLSGLNMPTDIKRSGDRTFYVLSYFDGTIQKLSY